AAQSRPTSPVPPGNMVGREIIAGTVDGHGKIPTYVNIAVGRHCRRAHDAVDAGRSGKTPVPILIAGAGGGWPMAGWLMSSDKMRLLIGPGSHLPTVRVQRPGEAGRNIQSSIRPQNSIQRRRPWAGRFTRMNVRTQNN